MVKIAVVGGSEFILGFQLAGIKDTIEADSNPLLQLNELKQNKELGIVVVEENIMDCLDMHQRSGIETNISPVFIPLSTKSEMESMRSFIRRSIGVDLMKQ